MRTLVFSNLLSQLEFIQELHHFPRETAAFPIDFEKGKYALPPRLRLLIRAWNRIRRHLSLFFCYAMAWWLLLVITHRSLLSIFFACSIPLQHFAKTAVFFPRSQFLFFRLVFSDLRRFEMQTFRVRVSGLLDQLLCRVLEPISGGHVWYIKHVRYNHWHVTLEKSQSTRQTSNIMRHTSNIETAYLVCVL